MAEELYMGTYRLTAVTARSRAVDILGAVPTSRVAMVYADGPEIQMATTRFVAVTANTRNPDISGAVSSARMAMLYADPPVLNMADYRVVSISANTRSPDILGLAAAGVVSFIISPPAGYAAAGRIAFIINQQETGPAAYVPQFFMKVQQKEAWPTVADTVSTTRALQVFQKVVQKENVTMPWSQTRVVSESLKVLQQLAYSFGQSNTRVMSEAMQVLQSDLHQHIPVSMDYVLSEAMQVVQQTPMKIWQSPHYALSLAQWELYRTPMGFLPRSTTTAYHTSLKVLQGTEEGYLPWSTTTVGQVAVKTLFDYTSPMPDQGTNEVYQETLLALQHTDGEVGIVGPEQARQLAMQALQSAPAPLPQSDTRALSLANLVLAQEHYDPPESIGKTSGLQTVMKVAIESTDFINPEIMQSQTTVRQVAMKALQESEPMEMWVSPAIVPQAHIEWLQGANYPSPGDMVPPDKAALVTQLGIRTLQHADFDNPQSDTRALQMVQLTSQYLFYSPASDLAEKGIFIGQMLEAVAREVSYPDPAEPISPVYADQIAVTAAYNDDKFPDPTKEAKPGEAFLVVETIASGVEYPDPSVSQVWAEVTQTFVQKSSSDTFPDPSVPVSSVALTQISIQASTNADYPDPANMVSPAEVSQAISQVSHKSTFPNPANPASTITVDQTLQMVAIPDVTLYGVPDYAIKHRPIITISIVYIQTS